MTIKNILFLSNVIEADSKILPLFYVYSLFSAFLWFEDSNNFIIENSTFSDNTLSQSNYFFN